MKLYMPFETALHLFAMSYLVSVLLLTASQVCLAAIFEELGD